MEKESDKQVKMQEVYAVSSNPIEEAKLDFQGDGFTFKTPYQSIIKEENQSSDVGEVKIYPKARYQLRSQQKCCQTDPPCPVQRGHPFGQSTNTSDQSTDAEKEIQLDPVAKEIYEEIIDECKSFYNSKNSRYRNFQNALAKYIKLCLWPEPLCDLGKILMENGIFILAYTKYMALRYGESVETLLLLYERTVKIEKQIYEKEISKLKWSTYLRMSSKETNKPVQPASDTSSSVEPVTRKKLVRDRRPKLQPVTVVKAENIQKQQGKKEWDIQSQEMLTELALKFYSTDREKMFSSIAEEMGRTVSSVMNKYYLLRLGAKLPKPKPKPKSRTSVVKRQNVDPVLQLSQEADNQIQKVIKSLNEKFQYE